MCAFVYRTNKQIEAIVSSNGKRERKSVCAVAAACDDRLLGDIAANFRRDDDDEGGGGNECWARAAFSVRRRIGITSADIAYTRSHTAQTETRLSLIHAQMREGGVNHLDRPQRLHGK